MNPPISAFLYSRSHTPVHASDAMLNMQNHAPINVRYTSQIARYGMEVKHKNCVKFNTKDGDLTFKKPEKCRFLGIFTK